MSLHRNGKSIISITLSFSTAFSYFYETASRQTFLVMWTKSSVQHHFERIVSSKFSYSTKKIRQDFSESMNEETDHVFYELEHKKDKEMEELWAVFELIESNSHSRNRTIIIYIENDLPHMTFNKTSLITIRKHVSRLVWYLWVLKNFEKRAFDEVLDVFLSFFLYMKKRCRCT
jgi:hypothetical protein